MGLPDLPQEILLLCLENLAREYDADEHKFGWDFRDLRNVRLASKRLANGVAPVLFRRLKVNISLESLARLEEISRHPVIGPCIQLIEFNLSYYDPLVAREFSAFARLRKTQPWRLYRALEAGLGTVPFPRNVEIYQDKMMYTHNAITEWTAVAEGNYNRSKLTRSQELLLKSYKAYQILCHDQELARMDNEHLSRMEAALRRLPRLREIELSDASRRVLPHRLIPELKPVEGNETSFEDIWLSDSALFAYCLDTSRWRPESDAPAGTRPPFDLLSDIFSVLKKSGVFPTRFQISVSSPHDLRCFKMSSDQLGCMEYVLRHAENLSFSIGSWGSQSRPSHMGLELLTTFVRAYYSCPLSGYPSSNPKSQLKAIDLELPSDHSPHRHIPLNDLLPYENQHWGKLQSVILREMAFCPDELLDLVRHHGESLKQLKLVRPFLVDGTWAELFDQLKEVLSSVMGEARLKALDIKFIRPDSRDPRVGRMVPKRSRDREIWKYLTGRRANNPYF